MPVGGLAPFPLRLGGTAENGLTAAQHARIAADWLVLRRTMPIAVWTYTLASSVVTLHGYLGQNGAGSAYAWTSTVNGTGDVTFEYTRRTFVDPYGNSAPLSARSAKVGVHGSVAAFRSFELSANKIRIYTFDAAGVALDAKVTVAVY